MPEQVLYEDDGLVLTNSYILIKKYYFPLATSKTILFSDVQTVELNTTQGVHHRWGMCTKYLNNWFNLDSKRASKKKFIAIKLRYRNVKPSITPDDPDKVFQIIWENQTDQGRDYVQKTSKNVGQETQFAQQEVVQRMQEQKENQETSINEIKTKK